MSAKAILVFCAHALFVQSALSQCTSRAAVAADPGLIAPAGLAAPYGLDAPFAYNGLDAPYGSEGPYGLGSNAMAAPYGLAAPTLAAPYEMAAPCAWSSPAMDFTPTRGGALPVTSASAIPPVGLSVTSENVYEGILAATGELPFVGSVAVEGAMPTAGASAVNHACGNGINAMISESTAFAPGYPAAIEPAVAIAPAAAISPAAAIAPGFGYRSGWAGRGCGYAL